MSTTSYIVLMLFYTALYLLARLNKKRILKTTIMNNPLLKISDTISPFHHILMKCVAYTALIVCGTLITVCLTDLSVGFFLGQVNP